MNLVVDDAFEVKQPTKNDPDESRRPLGMRSIYNISQSRKLTHAQVKSSLRVTTSPSSRPCHEFDNGPSGLICGRALVEKAVHGHRRSGKLQARMRMKNKCIPWRHYS